MNFSASWLLLGSRPYMIAQAQNRLKLSTEWYSIIETNKLVTATH